MMWMDGWLRVLLYLRKNIFFFCGKVIYVNCKISPSKTISLQANHLSLFINCQLRFFCRAHFHPDTSPVLHGLRWQYAAMLLSSTLSFVEPFCLLLPGLSVLLGKFRLLIDRSAPVHTHTHSVHASSCSYWYSNGLIFFYLCHYSPACHHTAAVIRYWKQPRMCFVAFSYPCSGGGIVGGYPYEWTLRWNVVPQTLVFVDDSNECSFFECETFLFISTLMHFTRVSWQCAEMFFLWVWATRRSRVKSSTCARSPSSQVSVSNVCLSAQYSKVHLFMEEYAVWNKLKT